MQSTALVPGLLGPPSELADRARWIKYASEGLVSDGLADLLSSARPESDPFDAIALESIVCKAFGLHGEGADDWPIATHSYRYDFDEEPPSPVYRVDPVYVRPGLSDVHVTLAAELSLELVDAMTLVDELNQHFAGDPGRVVAGHPHRWYLQDTEFQPTATTAPTLAASGLVTELYPGAGNASQWRSFLNEAQMVLHASSTNERRRLKGLPTINSLWLWGGGAPVVPEQRWRSLDSDDALAAALWDALDEYVQGDALVVVTSMYLPAIRQDIEQWRHAFSAFVEHQLPSLCSALEESSVAALRLHPGFGPMFNCHRQSGWSFLKQRKRLDELVGDLEASFEN